MRDVNKAILIGRLGKDPEIVNFESGTKKASFPLATGESYTNKNGEKIENTDWHNIVMWRKLAELAESYLRKGDPVYIEGKIKTRSYEDKDGQRRYITEIETENFSMLASKSDSQSNSNNSSTTTEQPSNTNTPDDKPNDISFSDDLPF